MFEVTESVSNSRKIILITHPSVQANAFANYLTELLSVSVDVHNINKPLTHRHNKGVVVLFDIAVSNKKTERYLARYYPHPV
ncbi:DNA-binding transcriptional regulator CsgD [Kluyvera intermedia]|nr:DNA-binding transcriptional regulator CsgD [Kluyvera intermedia]